MININRIKIYMLDNEFINVDLPIDYTVELPDDMSMCLMVDSNRLSEELSNFESYYLDELDFIDVDYYPALNEILDYIGLNESIDGILDLMVDNKNDQNRLFYLKSVLYYTTTQEGKTINTYNLKVKHFDDLINEFSEDFVFFDVISNNEDYSQSEIFLMTYLNETELKNKFSNYIL
jgi:hypothetical protein